MTMQAIAAEARSLAAVAEGSRFRLARVLDQSSEFLRYLTESGLALGTVGEVERNPDGAGLMRIRLGRQSLSLALDAAGKIVVTEA
jgi:DtxR family Mn-dependent transcriptional regulator